MDAAPTTVYLMLGERCAQNCAFCTQARESKADISLLSRVTWPAFPKEQVISAIARAYAENRILRACFQVTVSKEYLANTIQAIRELGQHCSIPISTSIVYHNLDQVASLLEAGASRVTLALDAAVERVYRQVKGPHWEHSLTLLKQAARRFPGSIGTHLIVGLGETEKEMVFRIQELTDLGITVGLFAFTPIPGTALAHHPPPSLASYRRVQVAHWLITRDLARVEAFHFDAFENIADYGPITTDLPRLLLDGEAFRTPGCKGCNRPYYNERPGGTMYNYPRPLTPQEAHQELAFLLANLSHNPQE
ncbi:MAG: radical SAM protein [Anaerolineae bacterium]|nr:radical SAM protein [Anaerolineae bacterium]